MGMQQHGEQDQPLRRHLFGLAVGDLGRGAGRAHDDDLLAGLEEGAEARAVAHLEDDEAEETTGGVHPGAGERDALHREARGRGDS